MKEELKKIEVIAWFFHNLSDIQIFKLVPIAKDLIKQGEKKEVDTQG